MIEKFKRMATKKGLDEDMSDTTECVMYTIYRKAQKIRYDHCSQQHHPVLTCAGQVYHPANFIEWLSNESNKKDKFWTAFHVTYNDLPLTMKQAIKGMGVSTFKNDVYFKVQFWIILTYLKKKSFSLLNSVNENIISNETT